MANTIWDDIKAASGIRDRTVDEVRNAVNSAVSMAAEYKDSVSRQAEGLSGEDREATLAGSVVGIDTTPRDQYDSAPAPGHEPEPERESSAQEEMSDEGPDF